MDDQSHHHQLRQASPSSSSPSCASVFEPAPTQDNDASVDSSLAPSQTNAFFGGFNFGSAMGLRSGSPIGVEEPAGSSQASSFFGFDDAPSHALLTPLDGPSFPSFDFDFRPPSASQSQPEPDPQLDPFTSLSNLVDPRTIFIPSAKGSSSSRRGSSQSGGSPSSSDGQDAQAQFDQETERERREKRRATNRASAKAFRLRRRNLLSEQQTALEARDAELAQLLEEAQSLKVENASLRSTVASTSEGDDNET